MPTPLDILRQYWGYDGFRPLQEEIIQSILSGQDTLALLPTGGGKSICFQVPGLATAGLTLVVSPLIALMKDQVSRLNRLGIAATYVNSSMSRTQVDEKLQGAMDGAYRFLYLAPERIRSEMFRMRLPQMPVKLLVVDEAHCISQWGYDFRPAYLDIHQIREIMPKLPIIAVTASAPPAVKQDIQDKLQMQDPAVFTASFRRDNLRYFVLEDERVVERIIRIAKRTKGSGIIYARTRRITEGLAALLERNSVSARAYHGGMKNSERDQIQQAWLENQVRIMVATNAFGMGIDKPDVRFVIHHNLPFDLESYYQEAGRGGRDGQTALAIAFKHKPDIATLRRWQNDKYPSWEQVSQHYELLLQHFRILTGDPPAEAFDFDLVELAQETGEPARKLYHSLKLLDQEGLIALQEDADDYGYLQVTASPQDILHYKEQRPQQAPLIDFLLRDLGGESYSREVRFLPENWSRRLDLPPLDLYAYLRRLEQHHLIRFTPPRDTPSLRFISPRQRLRKESLNWAKYDFLRKQGAWRLQEILRYVDNTDLCRSLMLQQYFGEQSHTPCGKCDVCIGRHKTQVSSAEFQDIRAAILTYLGDNPQSYRETLLAVQGGSPAQREKVLRYLMDKSIVKPNAKGILQVVERKKKKF